MQANPPVPQDICNDLQMLQTMFDSLLPQSKGSLTTALTGFYTQLLTDIANNNYSAAVTDLSNITGYITNDTFEDYVTYLNDWTTFENDCNANPPNQDTIQSDLNTIEALITKLLGETTGNFQSYLQSVQNIMTSYQGLINTQDWANIKYLNSCIDVTYLPELLEYFN